MRILVIGAGLGGLALAQGLNKAGIDVQVYEKDAAIVARFQGYRIGLQPYGWDALRTCLPGGLYDLAETTSGELTGPGLLFDEQLNLLSSGEIGPPEDSRVVDRNVFRHVLFSGLQDRVHFGRKLDHFDELPEGRVRAVFSDGSEDVGDVLVGADGGFSAVRARLLPEIGFVPSDLTGAMGRTPLTEQFRRMVYGRGTMIKGPHLTLMLGRMEFRTLPADASPTLPPTTSYVRWVLLLPPNHPASRPTDTMPDVAEVVLGLIDGWHPDTIDLIKQSDANSSAIGSAPLLDRPVTPWKAERVTLLGDAAHLTIASGGNGANTALRDAAALTQRLSAVRDGDEDLVATLRSYQTEMLEYGNAAVEFGKENQKNFVPESAPAEAL
jgi:2-polyprenyl-6-methoxyphenol hydroxylase-like FAD-dependent oxidoreductase